MKHNTKLHFIKAILPLFPMLLASGNGNTNTTSPNISKDSESVANFIIHNVQSLVHAYNEDEQNTTKWHASYVEDVKTVMNISQESAPCVYLDFDHDNGWAVVGNNFDFLDFSPTGDLEYTKSEDSLLWSEYDGFVTVTEEGYIKTGQQFLTNDELNTIAFNFSGKYSGFESGSDGIQYPLSYLNDRYGAGWYMDDANSKLLSNYSNVIQSEYSIYGNDEGNCTLSAYYGIFNYLRNYGKFNKLPSGMIDIDTSKDTFNSNLTVKRTSVPEIYANIREAAMRYGYTTSSTFWTSTCMKLWGSEALEKMGYTHSWYNSYIHMYVTWSFQSQVVNNINSGYPVMWNQARGHYYNHSMVVKGYQTYKKEHKFWFITYYESKHMMVINDNWEDRTVYTDYEGYAGDLIHEGFGTFTVVRDYAWIL